MLNVLPIYLVNLDKRPDRLKYVSDQLNSLELEFKRVSAIDGSLLEEDCSLVDKEAFFIQTGKPVTRGEIGCAMSHRSIWQEMLEKEVPYALILEDDVDISSSISELINSRVYEKMDFMNLSYTRPFSLDKEALSFLRHKKISSRPLIFSRWRSVWSKVEGRMRRKVFNISFLSENIVICECDPAPILASGYIISLKAATAFLKSTNSMSFPIDYTWRYCGGELKQSFLVDPLVCQTLGDSDILGRPQNSSLTKSQKIKRFFFRDRRIKRKIDLIKMYGWKFF